MKILIKSAFCLLVLLTSCKKDAKILVDVCSTKIDIGDFYLSEEAKQSIPYGADIDVKSLFHKENDGSDGGFTINHPVFLEHREGFYDLASSCEDPDAWNQYLYHSEQHYSHFFIRREYYNSDGQIERQYQEILVHATNRLGSIGDSYGPWGEYLRFYKYVPSAFHQLNTRETPFMSIPINTFYDGPENTNDFGYEFFEELELKGKIYKKVYANSNEFYKEGHFFVKVYYTFQEGLVALKGKDDTIWTIHF